MRTAAKRLAKAARFRQINTIGALATVVALGMVVVTEAHSDGVEGSVFVSSQYNFRGVAQNDRGVVQPQIDVSIPIAGDKKVSLEVWGNIDMSNDTGRGVLTDGNGGHLSEVDFIGAVTRNLGAAELTAGITSYNFPNGGASTSEAFLTAGGDVFGVSPSITVAYDFDLVEGTYVNGALQRSQKIGSSMAANIGVSLGFADRSQAEIYYGARKSGFADFGLHASLDYIQWDNKVFGVSIHASRLLDRDHREAVERDGLRSSTVWGGLTVGASY